VKCPECGGWGEVEAEEETGGVDANGPWILIRELMIVCEFCDGSGEIK